MTAHLVDGSRAYGVNGHGEADPALVAVPPEAHGVALVAQVSHCNDNPYCSALDQH